MKEGQKSTFQIPRPISSKIRYKTKIQVFSPQSYIFQFLRTISQLNPANITHNLYTSLESSKALCTQLGFTGCTYCISSLSPHQASSHGFVLIFLPDSTHAWQNPFIHKLKKEKQASHFTLQIENTNFLLFQCLVRACS